MMPRARGDGTKTKAFLRTVMAGQAVLSFGCLLASPIADLNKHLFLVKGSVCWVCFARREKMIFYLYQPKRGGPPCSEAQQERIASLAISELVFNWIMMDIGKNRAGDEEIVSVKLSIGFCCEIYLAIVL